MPSITLVTLIAAQPEVCFDLARSIELHADSLSSTDEKAVDGVTSGLIQLNEEVTWEASHFFVRQRLTSRITVFDRPHHFRDAQVRGAFQRFDHDHIFVATDNGTKMTDVFDYTTPLGVIGKLADWIFLERYMRSLIARRAQAIKSEAERGTARIDP
jgi:ligand-binding SRPBCC domain-containing protein